MKLSHSDTGEIVRTEDALGNVTEKMVDAIGNVLKLIPPNAYKGTIAGEEAFRYRYDYLDRRIETRDPYGTIHKTVVDMDGNVVKEIHPESYDSKTEDGEGVTYTYDADQYRTTRTTPDGGITRYKYDRNGNLIQVIQPEQYRKELDDGEGICYTYDEVNRLKQVIQPDGTVIKQYTYDLAGRLIEEADANGIATCYEYNRAGWLVRKWEPVEESKEGILYNLTCYAYDKAGNKIQEKRSGKAVEKGSYPAQWLILNFTYDKRNRLIKVEDSLGAAMEYTYDCLNNKASEKARINENTYQYTRYEYDAAGRLVKTIQSVDREDVGLEPNRYVKKEFLTTTYAYDKNGNVTKIVTPEGYEMTSSKNIEVSRISYNPTDDVFNRGFNQESVSYQRTYYGKYGKFDCSQEPIVVYDVGNGNYMMQGGQHRLKAAKDLGLETIKVNEIIPYNEATKAGITDLPLGKIPKDLKH